MGGQSKEYFAKYREKNRLITREKAVIARKIYKELIFQSLGRKCKKCNFSDKRALQIDHINGGGSKEKKKFRNQIEYYKFVLSEVIAKKNRYQILCANCNWIKREKDLCQ